MPLEERFALLMQANFAEIGIKSEVKKIPWALFSEQVTKPENTPNISQVFVNAVTGDPDTLIYGMYHSSAAGTWQSPEYLKDAKVDELLDKGRTVTSDEERAAAYTEVGKRLRELAPTIFAYDQKAVFAASKRVSVPALSDPSQGVRPDRHGLHLPPDGDDRIGRSAQRPAASPPAFLRADETSCRCRQSSASSRSGWEHP